MAEKPRAVSGKRHFAALAEEDSDDEDLLVGSSAPHRNVKPKAQPSEPEAKEQQLKVIHVTHLPPSYTQELLSRDLRGIDGITKISILPSVIERGIHKGTGALITFDNVPEAERAKSIMDGKYIAEGWRARAVWGKLLESTKSDELQQLHPFNARESSISYSRAPPPDSLDARSNQPSMPSRRLEIHVQKPQGPNKLRVIHALIETILAGGVDAEAIIMDREKTNPDFEFLFDFKSPEHIYYRWKLYSLVHGDSPYQWDTRPFLMLLGGPWWVPPHLPADDEQASENEQESAPGSKEPFLSRQQRDQFEWLVRTVTPRRGTIARAMAYALQHANAAEQIADILVSAITSPDMVEPHTKVHRLYIISDILHNASSGLSNVWKYRQTFEKRLRPVFEHLGQVCLMFDGRIKADNFRRQIASVLGIWNDWIVFSDGVIRTCQALLQGDSLAAEPPEVPTIQQDIDQTKEPTKPSKGWQRVQANTDDFETPSNELSKEDLVQDIDGVPLDLSDDEPVSEDEALTSDRAEAQPEPAPAFKGAVKFSMGLKK